MQTDLVELLPATASLANLAPAPSKVLTSSADLSQLVLSFHREVRVVEEQELVKLHMPLATQTLRGATPGMRTVLHTLAAAGATQEELATLLLSIDGNTSLAGLYYRLEQWSAWHVLRYTLAAEGRPLLTIEPISPTFQLKAAPIDASVPYALSRFAFCRRLRNHLLIESPLGHARVLLEGAEGAALIGALATPQSAHDLGEQLPGCSQAVALAALSLLAHLSLVTPADEDGTTSEDADTTLQQWNFHDLLFHTRSRVGRHDYALGATFRFLGKIPSQPAVKPKMSSEVIELYRPDIDELKQHDLPFTQVLEERQSLREYGDGPITLDQLGEFLYRTARVRFIIEPFSTPGMVYQASNRPYPGGGAGYELELYLTINTCAGLPAGIYHYDPLDHQLCKIAPYNNQAAALIDAASVSAARLCVPQVLITFAARFQRMGWKYDSMAYAATLKNVGVLYQTMYLVATAMQLAPCALGSGNADLLAQAAGLDYLKESSVGEFMLGSRKPHQQGG